MSSLELEIEKLEDFKVKMKRYVELGDAIMRLVKNPDYRKVIEQEFMLGECARFAQESGDPALTDRERADALAMAQAAGHLKRFISQSILMANQADKSIRDSDERIEMLNSGEDVLDDDED